jgi:hypothetical protein
MHHPLFISASFVMFVSVVLDRLIYLWYTNVNDLPYFVDFDERLNVLARMSRTNPTLFRVIDINTRVCTSSFVIAVVLLFAFIGWGI